MIDSRTRESSSFRDASGFIFKQGGLFYRTVSHSYQKSYDFLMESGLYKELVDKNYLIAHEEVSREKETHSDIYKTLLPKQLSFISYPFDWSFSMLKDAALLTLKIQRIALRYGMILKDASAYNIQFIGCQPVFIDTLSFDMYEEGTAWQAYGQFCRHFLAPLALMSTVDISLNKLLITHLDGIPVPLASKLLPFRTRFNLGLYLHLHLHAKAQSRYQDKKIDGAKNKVSKKSIENAAQNLTSTINGLKYLPSGTEWGEYYHKDVADTYLLDKKDSVKRFLQQIQPQKVLDLGANDGTFSRLAADFARAVYSFDIDPACVEQNYLALKKEKNQRIVPLLVDAANPQPAIGWNNQERTRLWDRLQPDTIMALALIHHLCISNNLPFTYLAEFFATHCQYLIIEWVPKSDEKVQRLLQNREDIFPNYDETHFLNDFSLFFKLEKREDLAIGRTLFLFTKSN
jgi:SAM-dependent methyltransferase